MRRVKFADMGMVYVVATALVALAAAACGSSGNAADDGRPRFEPGTVTAIGDSVMLAAEEELEAAGVDVDAVEGRQTGEALEAMERLLEQDSLGGTVVIHIGHNGPTTREQMERFISLAGPDRTSMFLTVRVPREWERANNALIIETAAEHANVELLDFRLASEGRAELFWDDRLHLRPEGAEFYAQYLLAALP